MENVFKLNSRETLVLELVLLNFFLLLMWFQLMLPLALFFNIRQQLNFPLFILTIDVFIYTVQVTHAYAEFVMLLPMQIAHTIDILWLFSFFFFPFFAYTPYHSMFYSYCIYNGVTGTRLNKISSTEE